MELLLILYAMLAGLTGLSGQGPARTQVTLGATAVEIAHHGAPQAARLSAVRGDRVPAVLRVVADARLVPAIVRVLDLPFARRSAPERRRE